MRTFGTPLTVLLDGGAPAAGADISWTVPAGHFYTIMGFSGILTTSAVVANRVVRLAVIDGAGNTMGIWGANTIQAASITLQYGAPATAMGNSIPSGIDTQLVPMPKLITLAAGMKFLTVTRNIQAGDFWNGFPFLFVEDNAS